MADLDNGKVEHPLTLGPKHWEEKEGVCVHIWVCVCVWAWGVWWERAAWEERFTSWPCVARTLAYTLTEIIAFL